MNKYLIVGLFLLVLLPLSMVSAANTIVGTQQFVITMGPWEEVQNVSIDQQNMVAYITLTTKGMATGQPITTTTAVPENFEYAPTAVTSIVIVEGTNTLDPAKYSVILGVTSNTINYEIELPTTPLVTYSTLTTVITNVVSVPTTTVETLSWDIYYPAYPVNTVNINLHETGYYQGISIGYYTVTTDKLGKVSTIYVPTVPAERNITIVWDPINNKVISGKVTISDMHVLPMVQVETALGKTYTVTRNATIVNITIGQFDTETDITMTRDGYNSYAVFVVYHNNSPTLTTYILPEALRALINYMQVVNYGSETVQWQGDGANAKPIVIVPYTAIFLTDTFTGNATLYFDDKNQEYVIYNATYTKTIYDDLMGVFTGTFNFTLTPGQWVGGLRYVTPIITSYTNVILVTKTQYTTTTFVVPVTNTNG